MISQLIEQSQAFLIMQQDSVLFVVRENGQTLIKQTYNVVSQLKDVAQSLNTVYPEQDLVSTNLTLAALAQTNSQQSSNF